MARRSPHILILVLISLSISNFLWANSGQENEHVFVSMRMIGHELLLASGDSVSRVLPIYQEGDRYKIEFESAFSFDPKTLTYIIDSIVEKTEIAKGYIVEIKDCDSGKVAYSYQVGDEDNGTIMPCFGRPLPEACYIVLMRIIIPGEHNRSEGTIINRDDPNQTSNQISATLDYVFYVVAGLVIILFVVIRIRKRTNLKANHIIKIGGYHFNHKNMTLVKGSEKQDLTGKETDLLQLLYLNLNSTVDRDVILKEVWKDEGVYIGRTLDVYVSKLRKKFESDPSIGIINVRGVGYKMTLD